MIDHDRQPVGVLEIEDRPNELYLALLELTPSWQGTGLGTDILRRLLDPAKAAGKPLALHVLRVNRRAVRFYEREGLRVVATEPPKHRTQST